MKRGYSIAFGGFRKKVGRRRSNVPPLRRRKRSVRRSRGKAFARKVRAVITRSLEKKRFDQNIFNDLSLNNVQGRAEILGRFIAQGTGNTNRVGNKITFTSAAIFVRLLTQTPNDVPIHVDLYFVVHKPGATAAASDILPQFFNTDSITGNFTTGCFRNQYEYQDFIVLRRRRMVIRPTINAATNFAECWIRWKGRVTMTWQGSSSDVVGNALYMIAVSSFNVSQSGDPPLTLWSTGRLYYVDA